MMHLELATNKAAFYVFAEFKGLRAVFSHNSFTLLPDRPCDLTFRTETAVPREMLEEALTIRHLRGSYEE